MTAISVRDLRKSYGDFEAVKGISFEVPEGSFFAFLGPNGAGKSTTISVICSLLARDSGEVEVFGKDVSDLESKMNIGVVFQDPLLDKKLTVRENCFLRAQMYGLSKDESKEAAQYAVETADALEFADRKYGELSGGQRRRADIARALVHRPRLLILDEPTSGLDPQTRKNIWEMIDRLNREQGTTILLTTHYMEEASGADDVVIINHGEIVAEGTPSLLRDMYCSDSMTFVPSDREKAIGILDSNNISYVESAGSFVIKLKKTADAAPIVSLLQDNLESFEVRTGTLDDAFIRITGEAME